MTYKNIYTSVCRTSLLAVLLVAGVLAVSPLVVRADTPVAPSQDAVMAETVRNAIMQDPRTARMSPAQIDKLVNALSQKAQEQGMTSHDIEYRPIPQEAMPDYTTSDKVNAAIADATCGNMPAFVCNAERALGIEGPRTPFFIMLGLLAGLLVALFAAFMMHHHKHGTEIQ